MQMPDTPQFEELEDLLAEVEAAPEASEAHGMLLGVAAALVPGGGLEPMLPEVIRRWRAGLELEASAAPGADSALSKLGTALLEALDPDGLPELALPPEDAPLRERTIAVQQWSQGFVTGLGLGGLDEAALADHPEAREGLRDLVRLAAVGGEATEESESGEEDLTVVAEYVRVVAAMLLERPDGRAETLS